MVRYLNAEEQVYFATIEQELEELKSDNDNLHEELRKSEGLLDRAVEILEDLLKEIDRD